MVIRPLVSMMKRLIAKDYHWIYMETMKAAACAKVVNTIQKESIAINANRNSIDPMEGIGMKLMCADVRNETKTIQTRSFSVFDFCLVFFLYFVACNCDESFSTGNCEEESGRCECRKEFQPPDCLSCSIGHFGYPNCRACECNINGTDGYFCESSNGQCPCKPNFAGNFCERCAEGYYGPECLPCDCDQSGSLDNFCDVNTGQCHCTPQFDGKHCDRCKDGYYGNSTCSCTYHMPLSFPFLPLNDINLKSTCPLVYRL